MKKLITITSFFSLITLLSCGGTSSATNTADSSATKPDASDPNTSASGNTFSYTINGQSVKTFVGGKGVAELFINEVTNDAAIGMLKVAVTPGKSNVFDFQVANSGTTLVTKQTALGYSAVDKK